MKSVVVTVLLLAGLTSAAHSRPLSPLERAAVETAVKEQLIDPESARFKHPEISAPAGVTSVAFCGRVNSKNRMGGYVGDAQFMAAFVKEGGPGKWRYRGEIISMGNADPQSIDSQTTSEMCVQTGQKILAP